MNRLTLWLTCSAMGAGLLCGCASAPKENAPGEIQQLVSDRTGLIVQWNGHTADDEAIAASVAKLLHSKLTADQAAQIALLNNRHLQATFEDLGIAQADLVQAGLLKNPVFDIGVRFPDRGPSGTYLDIAAAEDFLDIALIPARKKLAQSQFEQAKAKVSNEVLSLAGQARSAFYMYQAANEMMELRKTLAQSAAASLEVAQKLHDAGNINDLDLANHREQEVRAAADLIDAESAAAEARERVNNVMGVWGADIEWKAADHLPDLPAEEISGEGLESLAIRQRQDIAAAHRDILVQARTLGLTADYRFLQEVDSGPEFEHETDGQWRIGPTLSVPIPLFDQGEAKVARAQAMLRQSEERYYALSVDVRSEVREAGTRLLNARAKALLYRDQVLPIEKDLLEQTQLQYNGMFVGVFELLQARREQIDTASQYIEAIRDYWIARSDLERAVGGRLTSAALPANAATQPTQTDSHGAMP